MSDEGGDIWVTASSPDGWADKCVGTIAAMSDGSYRFEAAS
jgi:hypothetical protein